MSFLARREELKCLYCRVGARMYIGFRRTLVQAVRYRPQLYRESPGAGRRNGETDNVREAERILCIQSRTHARAV